jgi:hypothetical protein
MNVALELKIPPPSETPPDPMAEVPPTAVLLEKTLFEMFAVPPVKHIAPPKAAPGLPSL